MRTGSHEHFSRISHENHPAFLGYSETTRNQEEQRPPLGGTNYPDSSVDLTCATVDSQKVPRDRWENWFNKKRDGSPWVYLYLVRFYLVRFYLGKMSKSCDSGTIWNEKSHWFPRIVCYFAFENDENAEIPHEKILGGGWVIGKSEAFNMGKWEKNDLLGFFVGSFWSYPAADDVPGATMDVTIMWRSDSRWAVRPVLNNLWLFLVH